MTSPWPADYGVPETHCDNVLKGSYDVPLATDAPPVILDIGANVGAFAIWAAKRWPGATIHCYEPHPRMFSLLKRTLANVPNSHAHELSVTHEGGCTTLYCSVFAGCHSLDKASISEPEYHGSCEVGMISATTLPEADILKVDTEGSETGILFSLHEAGRLVKFKAVMLEIHSPQAVGLIEGLMATAGFHQTKRHQWHENRLEACYVRNDLIDHRPMVWIATPLRTLGENGVLTKELWQSLDRSYTEPIDRLAADKSLPWQFTVFLVGGGGVARARNKFASAFMKSTAERLFNVDYDLLPSFEDYVRILTMMDKHNLPVLGGLYTIREAGGHWVLNFPDVRGPLAESDLLMQVGELGTGFKCYQKWGLNKIFGKNPWLQYWDDEHKMNEWGFFSMGPVKDKLWERKDCPPGEEFRNYRWLTEDYWLDWLTRDAEMPVVVDTMVKLKHKDGDKVYPDEWPFLPEPGQKPVEEPVPMD